MKACKFCSTQVPDNAQHCPSCGSAVFLHICENCGTQFDSGFCPNCGVKAGEKKKVCPECGKEYFSHACPDCGYVPGKEEKEQPVYTYHREYTPPEPERPKVSDAQAIGTIIVWILWAFLILFFIFGLGPYIFR